MSFTRYQRLDNLGEDRDTLNVDFQHHFAWEERQDLVWGGAYRYSESESRGSLKFSLHPANLNTHLGSLFFQDELALSPHRLYLTLGTKVEHGPYTKWNLMPSVRVAWTPNANQTIWAAVSHAVRSPSEVDTAGRLNFGGFSLPDGTRALAARVGNPHFDDEGLNAYELGYRISALRHVSLDLASYFSAYSTQRTAEPAAPFFEASPLPPHLVVPVTYQNLMHGESHGLEVAANWKVKDGWTLNPGYRFEQIHMHTSPASHDVVSVLEDEHSSSTHFAQLRSSLKLRSGLTWDASAYFVDRLAATSVPSYTKLDTQLTWEWKENVSLALVGQDLVKDHQVEFIDSTGSVRSTLVKRSAYLKLTWSF